jgi:hypothetical protein
MKLSGERAVSLATAFPIVNPNARRISGRAQAEALRYRSLRH